MNDATASRTDQPRRELDANLEPSRAWLLGLIVEPDGRVSGPALARQHEWVECNCPDFCERDHPNE